MFKITYCVRPKDEANEAEWLKDQLIVFRVSHDYRYDTKKDEFYDVRQFHMILGSEQLFILKLRHPDVESSPYRSRHT